MKSFLTFILACLLVLPMASAQNLNEGFEGTFPPTGWTVFEAGATGSRQWQQATNNPNSGSSHALVRFDNVDADIAEDWLVTPKILPTAGNNTLTFFATDDFAPPHTNSVYTVRVTTGEQNNPAGYTTVFTFTEADLTNDVYQQFSVDLSAFNGQEIFAAFVLENDNDDSFFLDDVAGPGLVAVQTPPNCDAMLLEPTPGALAVEVDASLTWSTASNAPTRYFVQIGTTEGGDEFLMATDVGANLTFDPPTDFDYKMTYYVTILPYNASGVADGANCQSYSFTTIFNRNIVLDCMNNSNTASVSETICYENAADFEFSVSSNDNSSVQIAFNAGTLEDTKDEIMIYEGTDDTGTLLNDGMLYGNDGNLAGLTYTAVSGNLFIRISSDATLSCADGNQTAIDFTATCANCTPAEATAVAGVCDRTANNFYIDVNATGLGDGFFVVANDQNASTEDINTLGTTTVGPFNFGTVTLTLQHPVDPSCHVILPAITVNGCAPVNDNCSNPTVITASTDFNCINQISGTTAFASRTTGTYPCSGFGDDDDVWYSFTPPTTGEYLFQTDVDGDERVLIHIYQGACGGTMTSLSECFAEENTSANLVATQTYFIQLYTINNNAQANFDLCVFAAPTAPANDLCTNAKTFDCQNEQSLTLLNENATFSTDTDKQACNNNVVGKGMWYKFTGNGGQISIAVSPSSWDAEVQLWSGDDCNALQCETRADEGTTNRTEHLTYETILNTDYYVYVGRFNEDASGTTGMFDISFTCAEPLAAELLAFDGLSNGKTNTLRWSIGATSNMLHYVVERSSDGLNDWENVGTVKARDEVDTQYQWEDTKPLPTNYYRLKMVEQDGRFAFSEIVFLELNKNTKLQVVPNPSTHRVNIKFDVLEAGHAQIELHNLTGQRIQQLPITVTAGTNEQQILLDKIGTGIYVLTVRTQYSSESIRLIKK